MKGSFKMRLLEKFAGSDLDKIIGEKVAKKVREQYPAAGSKKEDIGWQPLSTRGQSKLLDPLTQEKMLQICYWLYDKNPLGHRILERTKDFVMGDGFDYDCSEKEAKDVLDMHYSDPINAWEVKQYQKALEIGLYGEQFYPAFVNESNGLVRLGYVDPVNVIDVQVDPNNAEVHRSYKTKMNLEGETETFRIVNMDENPKSETYGLYMGQSFYFAINRVSNAKRGRSDLFSVADAIDAYENFLMNLAERADLLTRIVWDLKMSGKSAEEIQKFLETFDLPDPGTIFGHNENLELSAKVPDINAEDMAEGAKQLLYHIFAGAGVPPHWFAHGQELTRATAIAMDLPTKKQLKNRQAYIKYMVGFIFRYQIHQAIRFKRLDAKYKDVPITITFPKIEEKELSDVATTLINLTNSLSMAVEEGWIKTATAKKVYASVLTYLGAEADTIEQTEKETEPDEEPADESGARKSYEKRQAELVSDMEEGE